MSEARFELQAILLLEGGLPPLLADPTPCCLAMPSSSKGLSELQGHCILHFAVRPAGYSYVRTIFGCQDREVGELELCRDEGKDRAQVTHLSGVSGLEVKAFNASELPCRGQQLYALGFSQFCE